MSPASSTSRASSLLQIAFIGLAVSLWRRAARSHDAAATVAPAGLDPATAAR